MTLPSEKKLSRMFSYLDDLRESGVTNMLGARPYVKDAFKLGDDTAGDVLKAWMRTFSREIPPVERARKALTT